MHYHILSYKLIIFWRYKREDIFIYFVIGVWFLLVNGLLRVLLQTLNVLIAYHLKIKNYKNLK